MGIGTTLMILNPKKGKAAPKGSGSFITAGIGALALGALKTAGGAVGAVAVKAAGIGLGNPRRPTIPGLSIWRVAKGRWAGRVEFKGRLLPSRGDFVGASHQEVEDRAREAIAAAEARRQYYGLDNPRRPTREFMRRCTRGVGPGYSPGAVCASTWQRMGALSRRKWLARENPGGPSLRGTRGTCFICHKSIPRKEGAIYSHLGSMMRAIRFSWCRACDKRLGEARLDRLLGGLEKRILAREKQEDKAAGQAAIRAQQEQAAWLASKRAGNPAAGLPPEARYAMVAYHYTAPASRESTAVVAFYDRNFALIKGVELLYPDRMVGAALKAQGIKLLSLSDIAGGWRAVEKARLRGRNSGDKGRTTVRSWLEEKIPYGPSWKSRGAIMLEMKKLALSRGADERRADRLSETWLFGYEEGLKRRGIRYEGGKLLPGNPGPKYHHQAHRVALREFQAAKAAGVVSKQHYWRGRVDAEDDSLAAGQVNPSPAWHRRQRAVYGRRLAGDLAAGHGEAADYWQGAASAEGRAVAANTNKVEGVRLKKLPNDPARSYRGFHGVPVRGGKRVMVPEGWPRKLWHFGKLVEMLVEVHAEGLLPRLRGGTLAGCPRNDRLFILGASPVYKPGIIGRVTEIQYTVPGRSRREQATYVHSFDNPPQVRSLGGGYYVVTGQGLKLTRRGIVG